MNQRASAPARVFASLALVCGFLIVVVVIATSLGGDGDGSGHGSPPARQASGGDGSGKGPAPKAYVVQNGDTLTSIAHETGVSVVRIQQLNPAIDPQILISGEKLKLR